MTENFTASCDQCTSVSWLLLAVKFSIIIYQKPSAQWAGSFKRAQLHLPVVQHVTSQVCELMLCGCVLGGASNTQGYKPCSSTIMSSEWAQWLRNAWFDPSRLVFRRSFGCIQQRFLFSAKLREVLRVPLLRLVPYADCKGWDCLQCCTVWLTIWFRSMYPLRWLSG